MTSAYQPDFAVHPGEHLKELLETHSITQAELAGRLGVHKKTVNAIVKGKAPVSPDVALRLGRVFNYPAKLWNNMQRNYDETVACLAERERLESRWGWLRRFPLKDMANKGWIKRFRDKSDQLDELLRFFGVASPEQWEKLWRKDPLLAYRQTEKAAQSYEAVTAWLRRGEIEARQIQCGKYDPSRFRIVLDEIRPLTTAPPREFVHRMQALCASAGLALVFVPELPKTGVYGVTRWLNGKPVIQLSLYRKTNDHLWFTFFHEAGHILKHGRKEIFIEGKGSDSEKEQEANTFACNKLIPPVRLKQLIRSGRPTLPEIERFADSIGIAPGIVVGRLQHDGMLPMNVGNKLKSRYQWQEEADK